MGAGLLAVKRGFILFIKSYQFPLHINKLERISSVCWFLICMILGLLVTNHLEDEVCSDCTVLTQLSHGLLHSDSLSLKRVYL
jgi:hypothetical protein